MESEFVQESVLIYGYESVKGEHLPLIYVRGVDLLWLLQFLRSWEESCRVGCVREEERGEEEEEGEEEA